MTEQGAARAAVKEVLLSLGLDADDPIELQAQFAAMREFIKLMADPEFQKDMTAVRAWRKDQEAIKRAGIVAVVGALVTAVFAAAGLAARSALLQFIATHGAKHGP